MHVRLGADDVHGLPLEQGSNGLKQLALRLNRITTTLGDVDKVQYSGMEMCECCNRLHFDRVPLVKRAIQDTRGIDNLPSLVLVVCVPDKQTFGCKRKWLHFHVSPSDVVNETAFPDVGVARHKERSCRRVDRRQPREMPSYLLQVL